MNKEIVLQITNSVGPKTEFPDLKGPEFCGTDPEYTAKTMLMILSTNYGKHNLTSSWEPLAADIKSGKVLPFIRFDNQNNPIACAALIKLNETDVEIGRGACLPNRSGGNSLPLLIAANSWLEGKSFPETKVLRAEVRTAKPTKEVPGGQATQVICFNKIGLIPTAIAPLFHHGVPDRQEMFILSSIFKDRGVVARPEMIREHIPAEIFSDEIELQVFCFFWEKMFGEIPKIQGTLPVSKDLPINFAVKQEGPFVVLQPATSESKNDPNNDIQQAFSEGKRFALARVRLTSDDTIIVKQVLLLKKLGFRLMGFEPVILDNDLNIFLLFGKLSEEGKEKLVAPCFVEGGFPHAMEAVILKDFLLWRRK